ncbi:hypothetical protein T552_00248 [Pneumocystis carinii B80]|uniref:1-phosphatidylinositol-3-phosphate 5-kinase n=1 Tax=Pneumocystis carinii (strain B80) TaxID=1408658 RepID=A0A0W4ZTB5_PNEC8|nr:hypothetical protein T552_00248 [Pneumocystis carinii B80]KTW31610.1 hypothetical protein T552_00248 [Pneumocystis carinii B80]
MGFWTDFLTKKPINAQNIEDSGGLTSFKTLNTQESNINEFGDRPSEEYFRERENEGRFQEREDEINVLDEMYALGSRMCIPEKSHYKPNSGIYTSNTSIYGGSNNSENTNAATSNPLKRLTALFLRKTKKGVGPVVDRVSVLQDGICRNIAGHSVQEDQILQGQVQGIGVSGAQLPGFILQHDVSSDSEIIWVPPVEQSFKERSISMVLERLRTGRLGKDFWMKDENCRACFLCDAIFTGWRRRHHCRTCGQIFCSKCTTLIPGKSFGHIENLRVCNRCHAIINEYVDVNGEEGNVFSEKPCLRSISQNLFRSNHFMEVFFPKKQSLDTPFSPRNSEKSTCDVFDTFESMSPASFGVSDTMDNNTFETSENYLASSFKSFNLDPTDDKWSTSKHEWIQGKRKNHVLHKRNHFVSHDIKSFSTTPGDMRKTSNRMIVSTPLVEENEDVSSEHSIPLPITNEKLQITKMGKKKAIRFDHRLKKQKKVDGKQGNLSVSEDCVKDIELTSENALLASSFPSISKKKSHKVSPNDTSLKIIDSNSFPLYYVRELLKQLLRDSNVSSVLNWEQILTPMLFKIVDNINPNLRNGDDIDVRHYVKIKKIIGDPTLSCYVQGLVFTKKLALKKMSTSLINPRIVLITFPIEYHRTETHFMSLDPVIAQEKEYLRNLVNRIISLHPTILFVEKSVSGLAMQYLFESNIVVASNVKPSVIQAISRCTRADIISSIDKLALSPRIGKCAYFNLKTFVNPTCPNTKKTFIFLEGCPKDLGCTIILRGSTIHELSTVKRITELMVYVVYNLKLETCLMRDHFISLSDIPSNKLTSDLLKDSYSAIDRNTPITSYDAIIEIFETRLLSASPYVKFPPPYMLLKARDSEKYLKEFLNDKKSDILDQKINNFLKEMSVLDNDHLLLNINLAEILKNAEIEKTQQELKIQEKNWKSYFVQDIGVASPFSHQGFAVLYSSVCTASAIPCKGPGMNIIEYYRETDCTLGQYIEDMCSTVNIICNANLCGRRLFEHHRSYVHDHARITVFIQELDHTISEIQKNIFLWSQCKICKKSTPMIPMSENTWKYSFGKYLELIFYNISLYSKASTCNHDINRDHIRYFGYQNFAIRFQFDYIELYDLSLPRVEIIWKSEGWIRLKLEEYNSIKSKIEKFCDSVEVRLNSIPLDTIPLDKIEGCKFEVDRFKKKIKDERTFLLNFLKESYENSHPLKILPLNRVLRSIQEMVIQWDVDFSEFDKYFFPSEKDIRRFTSSHLKKLFMDKELISDHNYSKGLEVPENLNSEVDDKLLRNKNGLLLLKKVSSEKDLNFMSSSESEFSLNKNNSDTNISHFAKNALKTSNKEQNIFTKNTYQINDKLVQEICKLSSDNNNFSKKKESDDNAKETSLNDVVNTGNEILFDNNNFSNSSQKLDVEKLNNSLPASSIGNFSFKNYFFRKNFAKILKSDQKKTNYNYKKDLRSTFKNKRDLDIQFRAQNSEKFSESASYFSNDFDPLDKEFEKQRIHKRRLKIKKNYSFLPSSSKPIVEVFQNVQEAVNETSDDDLINEHKKININLKKKDKYELNSDKKGKKIIRRSRTIDSFNLYGNKMNLENSQKDSDISSLEILYTSPECFKFPNDDIIDEIPTHGAERISLMKSLFAFWADRAAVGWSALNYPLNPCEHVFADSDVIIREDEPSSLIAFTLSSVDYLNKLKEMEHIKALYNIIENSKTEENLKNLSELTKKPLENALLKLTGTHLKYQFQEGSTQLFCKVFYAEQFDAFRRACKCDEDYLSSLSRCFKWDSSGGKSGSAFLKTRDDRLVLKQLSRLETEAFIKFAPSYFEYMSQAFFHELPTAMAKIIGFYQIGSRNPHTGKLTKMDVLVTENLFYGKKTSRIFDLKGSMRNRHVQSTGKENEVLLDENLVEFIYDSPLFIREHFKRILRASLWNDTLFLAKMNVMDYSMVVGIDDERQELVVGIIDCIRTYTWDKKLESWVKEKGLVGGGGKEPTVVTPRQYKNRFREAMDSYIYGSPSCWYLFESALGLKI